MTEQTAKKAIPSFRSSVDRDSLVDRLLRVEVDQVITYDEMNSAIGRDIQNGARYVLAGARRVLRDEHHILFSAVTGIGLKRLGESEKIDSAGSRMKRIRNQSNSMRKEASTVDIDSISDSEKNRVFGMIATSNALAKLTHKKMVEKIADACGNAYTPLPCGKVLDVMKR